MLYLISRKKNLKKSMCKTRSF